MAKAVQMLDDVPWLWAEGMSTLVERLPCFIVETLFLRVYGMIVFNGTRYAVFILFLSRIGRVGLTIFTFPSPERARKRYCGLQFILYQFRIMCNPNISQHSPLPKTSCSLVIIKLSIFSWCPDVLDIRTCARAAALFCKHCFGWIVACLTSKKGCQIEGILATMIQNDLDWQQVKVKVQ